MAEQNKQSTQQGVVEGVYVDLQQLIKTGLSAKGFSFLPRQPIHSVLSGRHSSRLRGRGMDFNELKLYRQGDDSRNIDWKSTRRTGKAHVRIFNEERDRKVWLVVSQQRSMFFGSANQFKSVSAAHAAALALFRVMSVGDRVGAVVYNDEQVSVFPPQKNRRNVMTILEEICRQNQQLSANTGKTSSGQTSTSNTGQSSQLDQALKHVSAAAKHDDLIVLIGDGSGVDEAAMQKITRLAVHNDILALMITDPLEQEMSDNGSLLFSDAEQFVDINTSDGKFRQNFRSLFEEKLQRLEHASRSRAIPLIRISTHRPVLDQVMVALGHARSSNFKQRS